MKRAAKRLGPTSFFIYPSEESLKKYYAGCLAWGGPANVEIAKIINSIQNGIPAVPEELALLSNEVRLFRRKRSAAERYRQNNRK